MNFDITYCSKHCEKGMAAQDEFLEYNNSGFDAAVDFWAFTAACIKTCPYQKIKNEEEAT